MQYCWDYCANKLSFFFQSLSQFASIFFSHFFFSFSSLFYILSYFSVFPRFLFSLSLPCIFKYFCFICFEIEFFECLFFNLYEDEKCECFIEMLRMHCVMIFFFIQITIALNRERGTRVIRGSFLHCFASDWITPPILSHPLENCMFVNKGASTGAVSVHVQQHCNIPSIEKNQRKSRVISLMNHDCTKHLCRTYSLFSFWL